VNRSLESAFDILPGLKAEDSYRAAHSAPLGRFLLPAALLHRSLGRLDGLDQP
jgi:hypothetical protein